MDCSQRCCIQESDKLATLIRRDVPSGIYHCDGCSGSWGGKEVLDYESMVVTQRLIYYYYQPQKNPLGSIIFDLQNMSL